MKAEKIEQFRRLSRRIKTHDHYMMLWNYADANSEYADMLFEILGKHPATFELCDNGEFYFVYTQFDFFAIGDDPWLQDELLDKFMAKVWSIVESYGFHVRRPARNRLGCHAWKGFRGFKTTIAGILGTFDYIDENTADEILMDIYRAYDGLLSPHIGGADDVR